MLFVFLRFSTECRNYMSLTTIWLSAHAGNRRLALDVRKEIKVLGVVDEILDVFLGT